MVATERELDFTRAEEPMLSCYSRGQWKLVPDFMDWSKSLDEELERAGYTHVLGMEPSVWHARIRIYVSNNPIRWALYSDDGKLSDAAVVVLAETDADMMDLRARWAPIVQAGAVEHLLEELKISDYDPNGLVEQVVKKIMSAIAEWRYEDK